MKPWLFPANYMFIAGIILIGLALHDIITIPIVIILGILFIRAGIDANLFGSVNRWIATDKLFGFNLEERQYALRLIDRYVSLMGANYGLYERMFEQSTANYRVFQVSIDIILLYICFVLGGLPLVATHVIMTLFGVQDYFYHIGFGNIQTMGESHYDEAPWMWWTIFGMFCTISRVRIPRKIVVLQAWIGILVLIGYGLFFV